VGRAREVSEDAMLDAFIIEEIKRREQERERRHDSERPGVQIPVPESDRAPQQSEEEKPQRGVIIIDYSMSDVRVRRT
jgi:hypothetical protein